MVAGDPPLRLGRAGRVRAGVARARTDREAVMELDVGGRWVLLGGKPPL